VIKSILNSINHRISVHQIWLKCVDNFIANVHLLCLLLLLPGFVLADSDKALKSALKGGTAIVANAEGTLLWQHKATHRMVPASIIKIATADAALSYLGPTFQFKTAFYLTPSHQLAIKGYGDPSLTSEALAEIAQRLHQLSLPKLSGLLLDTSYFTKTVAIHGQGQSNNPYDAANGALVVNFNTLYIRKQRNGRIRSAEPQTPLTATAKSLAKLYPPGKHRINLGRKRAIRHQYFAELMQAFLKKHGISLPMQLSTGPIPKDATLLFTHVSKPLPEIVAGLLQYSNNFTANQLLLVLGAEQFGTPATLSKGRQALVAFLHQLGLTDIEIEEGSGLSRKNRVTSLEMLRIVQHFAPYKHLLKPRPPFLAKTGTLTGVSTYAGFMQTPTEAYYPFVIMINREVPFHYRFGLATRLYHRVMQPSAHKVP